MNEDNKDHYRYMPPGSVPEIPEAAEPDPGDDGDTAQTIEEAIQAIPHREALEEVAIEEDNLPVTPRTSTGSENPELPIMMRFLYWVFSPLLVPTYVTLLVFLLSMLALILPGAALPYTLTVFGATCMVPLIAVYVLMRVGALKDFQMYDPRERILPYVIEVLALGGCTLFFFFKGAAPWIWCIYCGATAVALVNFAVNFRLRISNHCSAIAALLAALMVINRSGFPQASLFWWVVGTVIVAGYIGMMAVVYGRHSLREVLAGYATGFLGIILFSLIH